MKIFVLGSINYDIVATVKMLPKKGETIECGEVKNFIGGKGANQGVQSALLGAQVYFAGSIGNDIHGKTALEGLKCKNICTLNVTVNEKYSTGCAIITIDKNGDNTLVYAPGANNQLSKEIIDNAKDILSECDVFITQCEINLDIVEYGLCMAKSLNVTTVLNPTPAVTLKKAIFENTDYIIPNETESEEYTGIMRKDFILEKWRQKSAQWFLDKGCKNVVITMGEKGAYFYNGNKEYFVKAFNVNPIDTTAAGDSFIGGFAFGLASKFMPAQSVELGCACGALTTENLGAQNSIQPKEKIAEFLKKNNSDLVL